MKNSIENLDSRDICADSVHDFMCAEKDRRCAGSHRDSGGSSVRAEADPRASSSVSIDARPEDDHGRPQAANRARVADRPDRVEPTGSEALVAVSPRAAGPATEPISPGADGGKSPRATSPWADPGADSGTPGASGSPSSLDRELDRELAAVSAATDPAGSSVAQPTATATSGSSVQTSPVAPRRHTRSQSGIIKAKEYTNGTVRYDRVKRAFLSSCGEPTHLHDALNHKEWKEAMDS